MPPTGSNQGVARGQPTSSHGAPGTSRRPIWSFCRMYLTLDVVELGCGTGYVSAWLARRGGRCIGLDNSAKQLETARMLQREFDLSFPLVHADAERAPFADGSFDFAISEYGAAIWCDPYRWIPEAARLLRPGGRLVFLCYSNLIMLCMRESESEAATAELLRDLLRDAPVRVGRRGRGRVRDPSRRDGSTPAQVGVRDRRSDRARSAGGSDQPIRLCLPGVGAPVAERRGLEGSEDRVAASGRRRAFSLPQAAASRRARS